VPANRTCKELHSLAVTEKQKGVQGLHREQTNRCGRTPLCQWHGGHAEGQKLAILLYANELVDVDSKYVYLGINTPTSGLNWRADADCAVAKAEQCSTNFL
jgi:hypothetical protein